MGVRFRCEISHVPHPSRNNSMQDTVAVTTVEVAGGNILPVEEFGTTEVGLKESC